MRLTSSGFCLLLLGAAAILAVAEYALGYYFVAYGASLVGVGYLFYRLSRWLHFKRLPQQLDDIF